MKKQCEYEEIYTELMKAYEDSQEEQIEKLRDTKISRYRVKTIRSGEMLECEIYPLWDTGGRQRKKRGKKTKATQVNLNNKNSEKHLIRLINTNFTKLDIWITLTYKNDRLPKDMQQAKKDMNNYIRRLKRHIKKHKLPDLKYIYVTEHHGKRVHHHMICNFTDRDLAEVLWDGGGRTQSRRLQPDDFGLEGLARYIAKEKRKSKDKGYQKRYTPSRNLKQPIITVADSKMTKRRAEKIASDQGIAPDIFEKMYKNYYFKDLAVKYSSYAPGAYLYVRMKRSEQVARRRDHR